MKVHIAKKSLRNLCGLDKLDAMVFGNTTEHCGHLLFIFLLKVKKES